MQPDVLTVLLWFFLGCNPSLAVGNHWDYSAITSQRNDHSIQVDVVKADSSVPDAYQLSLHYRGQNMLVEVYHQLNGYRVQTLQPSGVPDQMVPLIPRFLGRPWMGDWSVASFMMDRYEVGAEIGPNDRVYVADVADRAGHKARAMFFEKIGLRRLLVNHWDFAIVDVKYAHNPYRGYNRHDEEDPVGLYSHDRDGRDELSPDSTDVQSQPYWGSTFWDHGGETVPHEPSQPDK